MAGKDFGGFKVLYVKLTPSSLTGHALYIKEHSVREYSEERPPGRTLFVLNVPPFVAEDNLRHIFGEAGSITSVQLQDKPSSSENGLNSSQKKVCFKVAYIVFNKKSELSTALKINELIPLYGEDCNLLCGAARWIKDYNTSIPSVTELNTDIESFMKNYDEKIKDKLENSKSMAEADDEGWITVTKHGKKSGFERKETVGNKIIAQEKTRQQKKELKNFYSFQIRESKMKHIITLRQKFEEDKKKIALLKESRRFRPF